MKQKLYLSTAYLDDLMVRMAHHSTAIEGNSLTQGETKSVLIDGYVPRAIDLRELNEVLNYSAKTGAGIDVLLEKIGRRVENVLSMREEPSLTRVRHRQALEEAGSPD